MFRITRQFELQIEHPPESQIKRITDEVWSGLDDLARAWRTQAALRISYSRDANTRRAPCYPEMGWVVPGSYGPCTTIAANPSGCTYRRTRASPPLWRMRTRDTRERSSYHRLALRRRLYPTAKSTNPVNGGRAREKQDVPLAPISSVQLRCSDPRLLIGHSYTKSSTIGGAPTHANDSDQQRMTWSGEWMPRLAPRPFRCIEISHSTRRLDAPRPHVTSRSYLQEVRMTRYLLPV